MGVRNIDHILMLGHEKTLPDRHLEVLLQTVGTMVEIAGTTTGTQIASTASRKFRLRLTEDATTERQMMRCRVPPHTIPEVEAVVRAEEDDGLQAEVDQARKL